MDRDLKQIEAALLHDLNNLLQVMMGNLELLKRRGELVPEIVDAALAATREAGQLTDRLVAVGRLQAHEPRVLDINHLLRDHLQMIEHNVGDAIRVETEFAADLMSAFADRRALQVALLELTANAREAMPGGGRLHLRTANAAPDLVLIELVDTGGGMPAQLLPRAFEPLAAAEGGKLAGLGLHIVERCMRQAGGRFELVSEKSGTRVRLYLPAAK